jgi:hypothetical protein
MERKACEVRLRAERRAGELFSELGRAPADHKSAEYQAAIVAGGSSEYRAALERTRTPERTARRYQELAAVPRAQFDAALEAPEKPSTNGILRAANGATSLELWRGLTPDHRGALAPKGP